MSTHDAHNMRIINIDPLSLVIVSCGGRFAMRTKTPYFLPSSLPEETVLVEPLKRQEASRYFVDDWGLVLDWNMVLRPSRANLGTAGGEFA